MQRESRAVPRETLHLNAATHLLSQQLSDGQSQPCPFVAAGHASLNLPELLEDISNSSVGMPMPVPLTVTTTASSHVAAMTLFGELDRIAGQVEQDLFYPHRIANHRDKIRSVRDV